MQAMLAHHRATEFIVTQSAWTAGRERRKDGHEHVSRGLRKAGRDGRKPGETSRYSGVAGFPEALRIC
jgi:hypothetical protein